MHAGEELPAGSEMPAREASALFGGARVAVAGKGATAAVEAPLAGAALPRCPASLLLCERRPQWGCRACGRKYRAPAAPLSPACILCGLPLGPARPAVLLNPPFCS